MDCSSLLGTQKSIIGMVHLAPLPGVPGATTDLTAVCAAARRDAERLVAGGVDGLMIENYGDSPFYPDDVPKHTVATMTRVGTAVQEAVDYPIGVNVLRNDAEAALSVAAAVDADYIRVNVHTGLKATDQGLIEGMAHKTLRLREQLGVDCAILADLDVKHAAQIGSRRSIAAEFKDCVDRGHADGVIVSGAATGQRVGTEALNEALDARGGRLLDASVCRQWGNRRVGRRTTRRSRRRDCRHRLERSRPDDESGHDRARRAVHGSRRTCSG